MSIFADNVLKALIGHVKNERDRYHMGKVLMKTLKKFGDKVNQTDIITGASENNFSILERSIKLATWLTKNGVITGDIILVYASNHFEACITLVASLFVGASILPAHAELKYVDLKQMVSLGEPKIVFCDTTNVLDELLTLLPEIKRKPIIVTYGKRHDNPTLLDFEHLLNSEVVNTKDFRAADFDPEQTAAFIYCTSGSTGMPKGVVLTHKTYIIRCFDFWFPEEHSFQTELFMSASPINWITGSLIIMACCIQGASRILSTKLFSTEIAFEIMNQYKPTITLLGPSILLNLVNHKDCDRTDWTSLRHVFVTGSALSVEIVARVQSKLVNGRVISCYGMTETCGSIATHVHGADEKDMPVGRIRSALSAKIVDTVGRELGTYEPGELLIKSDFIFKTYYKNEEATTESFTEDTWFKTGDILYYDDSKYFYYVDRLKMMMKYKNNQISPAELENVIQTYPGVAMVVVGKIEVPPDDLPAALVVKEGDSFVTAQDIKDYVMSTYVK